METIEMQLPFNTTLDEGVKMLRQKAEQTGMRVIAKFNGFILDSQYSDEENKTRITDHVKKMLTDRETCNIDWEQRRYEIAKTMLPAIYTDDGNAARADHSPINGFEYKTLEGCCREAIRFADVLINELKKKQDNPEMLKGGAE